MAPQVVIDDYAQFVVTDPLTGRETVDVANLFEQHVGFLSTGYSVHPPFGLIGGSSPWQAQIMKRHLLDMAIREGLPIRYIATSLNEAFYFNGLGESRANFLSRFRDAADAGLDLQILITDNLRDDSLEKAIFEVTHIRPDFMRTLSSSPDMPILKFLLVGERSYWITADTSYRGQAEFQEIIPSFRSITCFNDPHTGKNMKKFFDELYAKATSYDSHQSN